MKKRILNWLLLISFVITMMVPITGIHIHKLASALFLLLSIVHTTVYRKSLGAKKWGLLGITIIAFVTGIFGMILDQYTIVLQLHKAISIVSVFFLAIHIFVYHKRIMRRKVS